MKARISPIRSLGALVVVAVGIAVFAGSTPTSIVEPKQNAALVETVGRVTDDGGTLTLGSSRLCDSFDPARSFDAWCAVVFRLYSRNLMAFSSQPGIASFEVQPDLAQTAARVSASKMFWTFTLRPNARWNNGKNLSISDVQYSIERLYSPEVRGAISNKYLCMLSECPKGVPAYRGPGKKGQRHLSSIHVSGTNQITFKLTSPSPDFGRVLALPQFSIIEKSRDLYLRAQNRKYEYLPSSSGPFVLRYKAKQKQVSFIRNKYWVQASDGIRLPHVQNIKWRVISDLDKLQQETLSGGIDIRIGEDFLLPTSDLETFKRKFSKNLDQPFTGFTSFLAIKPSVGPLNRLACRQAIFYAVDKSQLQRIKGGSVKAEIATSMLPPNVVGYESGGDLYRNLGKPSGDLAAAESALKKCGYPEGFEVTMAYLNIGIGSEIFRSIQSSLAQVGIVVAPKRFDNYTKFISVTRNPEQLASENISLVVSGVQSQLHSPLDFWSEIADGRLIKPFGNENIALIDVAGINSALDNLVTEPSQSQQLSAKINIQIMQRAVYLPYTYDRIMLYRNPKVVGIYVQQALGGQYDLVNVGLVK